MGRQSKRCSVKSNSLVASPAVRGSLLFQGVTIFGYVRFTSFQENLNHDTSCRCAAFSHPVTAGAFLYVLIKLQLQENSTAVCLLLVLFWAPLSDNMHVNKSRLSNNIFNIDARKSNSTPKKSQHKLHLVAFSSVRKVCELNKGCIRFWEKKNILVSRTWDVTFCVESQMYRRSALILWRIKVKIKASKGIKRGKMCVYIVEISCQLLDVLLQLICCLQAILEETAEQRHMWISLTLTCTVMNMTDKEWLLLKCQALHSEGYREEEVGAVHV